MSDKVLTLEQTRQMAVKALTNHRTSPENAVMVAEALVAAEAEGQKGHGLSRLPSYCAQAASGKVDGFAKPIVKPAALAALRVDAGNGFAYPAMALAVEKLAELAPGTGIAAAAVHHSHHCGMAGYHVEALARRGMVGMLFANTPQAIAPWGGNQGLFGTNPIAFCVPREGHAPMVIDLSLSKVARGKIMFAKQEGQAIPEGWALDSQGEPTTDPKAALGGTMLPMGDAKGAALVLMVEILAAALTGANFGFEASSFFEAGGEPPSVGQLLIALAPGPLSGDHFAKRLETLLEAILAQPGTRLPGDRRLGLREKARQQGIALSETQYEQLQRLCAA
ncbi:MAG: Ldh family oxidoreductase [Deltaproteobacteria bacterium]|nr:Ldh family oxidoreductase [Deltaproteobacteria bacterium]